VTDLAFRWPGGVFRLAVDTLTIRPGERVLLLGRSGGGKSTLLSLIAGITTPDRGRVDVCGQDLARLSRAARDRFRADHIGIIFQMFNLLPYATALDNILVPMMFSAKRRARCPKPEATALEMTRALGLPDDLVRRGPASALSVGQQQRVAVARAMIGAPEIVIADEPTSALDTETAADFMALVLDQAARTGATLLMVSHDRSLRDRFDRVVVLEDILSRAAVPAS